MTNYAYFNDMANPDHPDQAFLVPASSPASTTSVGSPAGQTVSGTAGTDGTPLASQAAAAGAVGAGQGFLQPSPDTTSAARLESAGAWDTASPSATAQPSIQQAVDYGFLSPTLAAPAQMWRQPPLRAASARPIPTPPIPWWIPSSVLAALGPRQR